MKYLLFSLLMASHICAIGQTNIAFPAGTYRGGICEDNSIFCGVWYIKSDSSFVFTQFDNNSFLKSYGAGKWKLTGDSIIEFTFTNSLRPLAQQIRTIIEGETRTPTDSVFVTGQLITEGNPLAFASVVSNGKRATTTDQNGNFKIKDKNRNLVSLRIFAAISEVVPTLIELPSVNNVYKLTVELPKEQPSSCVPVYQRLMMLNRPFVFKIGASLSRRRSSLGIQPIENGKESLVGNLRNAAAKQPLLTASIAELLNLIEMQ